MGFASCLNHKYSGLLVLGASGVPAGGGFLTGLLELLVSSYINTMRALNDTQRHAFADRLNRP